MSSARLPATSARARIAATGRRSCATNRISLGRQSGRPLGASPETRLGRRRPRWRVCAVLPSEHGSAAAAGACAFGSAGIGLGRRCVLTYRYAIREIRIAPYRFTHTVNPTGRYAQKRTVWNCPSMTRSCSALTVLPRCCHTAILPTSCMGSLILRLPARDLYRSRTTVVVRTTSPPS